MKLTRYTVVGIRNYAKAYIESLIKLECEGSVVLTVVHTLKDMVVSGRLDSILEIPCKGYWPRYRSCYNQNAWAERTFFNNDL